ncbi:MAG: type II toxin-antitoxin system RelE/ParE family toxin [Gammaproteobacteria bacterium]|nr:type II toxin-antitoxin system RelE/ParE family toxin [Gammaproteobacteria bacterium]MYD77275.1 type II toxin-antitoxin system RelE/ParE family toxin [Gammaproteobacteria bacterium]MYJ52051.1 type II toxin-antitoxin system RelE/ParE family toxin [Gammaproteobacteria bacterium]
MSEYELAPEAERDLLDIALHGLENFGLVQSEQYRDGLKSRFQEIANNPLQYQAVDHIRQGYRRCVYRSHSIYYRIEGQGIAIMRILGRQSVTKALEY